MGIMTILDNELQNFATSFSSTIIANIASGISPAVLGALTLIFIWRGYLVMSQGMSIDFFLRDLLHCGLVVSVALSVGIYQTHISDFIMSIPNEFSKLVMNSDSPSATADNMIDIGITKAGEILESINAYEPIEGFVKLIIALLFGVCVCLIGIAGGASFLAIKLECMLIASVGSIFILMLLSKKTASFFHKWVGEIFSLVILSIFISIIFMFFLHVGDKFLTNIKNDDNLLYSSLTFFVFTGISILLFSKVTTIASKLSGSINAGIAEMVTNSSSQIAKAGATNFSTNAAKDASKVAMGATKIAGKAISKGLDAAASRGRR